MASPAPIRTPSRWKARPAPPAPSPKAGSPSQIVPVEIGGRKGPVTFATDEHPKATSVEALAGLRPAFQKDGTVTAGNAAGINDGAAALVLAARSEPAGLTPRARIMGYAHAGVDPKVMGIGPIPAVQALCAKLGITPQTST